MCVHCYVYCSEICHIPFTDVSAANVNRMMFKHVGFSSYFLFVSGTKCIPFQTNLTVQSSSPTLHTENKSTTTLTEPAVLNNFRLKSISGKILKLCCVLHLLKIPEANKSGTKKKNTIIKNKSKASIHHLPHLHASQGLHIREQTCVVRLVNGTCQINIVNYISLKRTNPKEATGSQFLGYWLHFILYTVICYKYNTSFFFFFQKSSHVDTFK